MNGLYFVTCNWYNDYDDKEETACAFVVAASYADAAAKITSDFSIINSLHIEEIQAPDVSDVNVVYVPNDQHIIDEIRNVNEY